MTYLVVWLQKGHLLQLYLDLALLPYCLRHFGHREIMMVFLPNQPQLTQMHHQPWRQRVRHRRRLAILLNLDHLIHQKGLRLRASHRLLDLH